jgi:hypothetical protein
MPRRAASERGGSAATELRGNEFDEFDELDELDERGSMLVMFSVSLFI